MRYNPINKNLFIRNREKLRGKLPPRSLVVVNANDELLRAGDQYFPYRQNSDLFYLTGLEQEKCILAICPDHPNEKLREIVFTIRPEEMMQIWTGHKYSKEEVREISGVATVMWLDEFEITLRDLMCVAEEVYLNQNEYIKLTNEVPLRDFRFAQKIRQDFPVHTFKRLAPLLTALRLVKEPEEIVLIQKACDLTGQAFLRVLQFIRPGVMEYEVEAEMTHEFIRHGANGHAYQPIIGSGRNALVLHYVSNSHECRDGELLLMDFGAEYGNFVSDCTRTVPVNGTFTHRQRECYEAVLRVMKKLTELYVPGNTIDLVYMEAFRLMEQEMTGLGLFTQEQVNAQDPDKPLYTKYLMHGVCHPIGLDVHDVGSRYVPFAKGMVLTLEPAIYIPEENIGIRIEDDIMVAEVPVNLMAHIPREADEIERLMAN
jgi:Xaa-Pro aminopeptidase